MKCPNCGYQNKKGIQFCVKCGSTIKLEYDGLQETPIAIEKKSPSDKEIIVPKAEVKKPEMNATDIYLEAERQRIQQREAKEQKKRNRYNKYNNLEDKDRKDAMLVAKIFIITIIITIVLVMIGLFAYEDQEETKIEHYGEYDYSDIKNNDDSSKENELYYNNLRLTFEVPNNLVAGDYALAYNKYFRDKDFTKSINYSIQKGKDEKLADSRVEYYTQQKNKSKNNADISKDNIKVADHDFIYVKYTYEIGTYTSTSIFGYSQIDDCVYTIEYRDYNSGDVLSLDKLFKYQLAKD